MKKKYLKVVFLFAMEFLWCLSKTATADQSPAWKYEGNNGPAAWGKLSSEFRVCSSGKRQSPVDIKMSMIQKNQELSPLKFSYFAATLDLVHNGHTIQLNYTKGSQFSFGQGDYELAQLDIHTPSEHKLEGKSFPLEMQFLHRNQENKLAIVALFVEAGEKNAAMEAILENIPQKAGDTKKLESKKWNALDLFPKEGSYYKYEGSLSTPPCTEAVSWFVLEKSITMSADQIKKFKDVLKMNARPTQPLGGRVIQEKV